jgi:hypothetical protein
MIFKEPLRVYAVCALLLLVACSPAAVPASFFDGFEQGLDQWQTWTSSTSWTAHAPAVHDREIGQPAPSLLLPGYDPISFQSGGFVYLANFPFGDGVIEMDVYFGGTDSLLDVVFRSELAQQTGYIARFDTRREYPDTLLDIARWKDIGATTNHYTTRGVWHHLRLEANGESLVLYNDGERVAWATDSLYRSGTIALLNEGGPVNVDNVRITRTNTPALPSALTSEAMTIIISLVIGLVLGGGLVIAGILIGLNIRRRQS